MRTTAAFLLTLVACGEVAQVPDAPPGVPDVSDPLDAPSGDAATDATGSDAPAQRAWGTPTAIVELNSSSDDAQATITGDGLRMCWTSLRGGGEHDLWCAQRQTPEAPFAAPVNQARINTSFAEWMPSVSTDGMTLFFSSNRAGQNDLYRARWDGAQYIDAVPLAALNTSTFWETGAEISRDGLTLFFESDRGGTFDLYSSTRAAVGEDFLSAVRLDALASSGIEQEATVSPDGSTIVFCSNRIDLSTYLLYSAERVGTSWSDATLVQIDEPPGLDGCGPELAPDGSLIIHSRRPGGLGGDDLYIAAPAP